MSRLTTGLMGSWREYPESALPLYWCAKHKMYYTTPRGHWIATHRAKPITVATLRTFTDAEAFDYCWNESYG